MWENDLKMSKNDLKSNQHQKMQNSYSDSHANETHLWP